MQRDDVQQITDPSSPQFCRWIVAQGNTGAWSSVDVPMASRGAGFVRAVANTLRGLPGVSVRTYATRAQASRAALRCYGPAEVRQ
jgi:hypothetical protein